ncbi:MAG: hypothetical protein Aureis2KO_17240 [Aureisphaera sp.]
MKTGNEKNRVLRNIIRKVESGIENYDEDLPHIVEMNKKQGVRNIDQADTAIESYRNLLRSGKKKKQELVAYNIIIAANEPLCVKDLVKMTGIEVLAMGRTFNTLWNKGVIYIAEKKKSKYSNQKVRHYLASRKNGFDPEARQIIPTPSPTSEADTVRLPSSDGRTKTSDLKVREFDTEGPGGQIPLFDGHMKPNQDGRREGING